MQTEVTRFAATLSGSRLPGSRLHPLVLMSDPERTPDLIELAQQMPERSALIYRHFGAPGQEVSLRRITTRRGVQLLIGGDPELAQACGADGVHFSRRTAQEDRQRWRDAQPDWIISAAAPKNPYPVRFPAELDAFFVSPVFRSDSVSAGTPLGLTALRQLTARLSGPIFALGGINAANVASLSGSGLSGIASISGLAHELRTKMTKPTVSSPTPAPQPIKAEPGTVTITKDASTERMVFNAHVAGSSATGELTLRRASDGVWNANHTGVPREIGGKGVGKALVAAMVKDARKHDYRVVPGCPFVAKLFDRKPEWAEGVEA